MENKGKLRVAVVGLTVGEFHVQDYLKSPSVMEIILCDGNRERLRIVGDKYAIAKRYTNYSEMLQKEKPNAVSLAVPNFLHCTMAIEAMESGCHVLCEKPLARNAEEAERMYAAMKRTGKKLMVNFNQRFNAECRAVKALIEEGKLGDVYFARTVWQRQRGVPWWYALERGVEVCGGGPIIDLGVHVLDRVLWFCGYPEAQSVLANTFQAIAPREAKERGLKEFPLEDMGVAMLRLKNGTMVELEASWASNSGEEAIVTQIFGSRGGVLLHSTQGNFAYLEESPSKVTTLPLNTDAFQDGYTVRQAFLDAILEDREVPCTAQEGVQLNRILDAVYQSAREGRTVEL